MTTGSISIRIAAVEDASTLADIHTAHQTGHTTSLVAIRPDLPPAFLTIVDKALAAYRHERFATAEELGEVIAGKLMG